MAEHQAVAAARLLLIDLERQSASNGLIRYELDEARKEIERLKSEMTEARQWLCWGTEQPYPDSLTHCAAFLHGRWREASRGEKP